MTGERTPSERLEELIAAACNDAITLEEHHELESLLRGDPAAQQRYLDCFNFQAEIRLLARSRAEALFDDALFDDVVDDVVAGDALPANSNEAACSDANPTPASAGAPAIAPLMRPMGFSMAVAFLVVVGALLGLSLVYVSQWRNSVAVEPVRGDSDQRTRGKVVAAIRDSHGAIWKDSTAESTVGATIHEGDLLSLAEGLVELEFADGATVVLQGESELVVRSRRDALLRRGSIYAKVPRQAIGFTIHAGVAKIVDLGTEFAVRSRADAVDVYVYRGSVSVETDAQTGEKAAPERRRIAAGQSIRVEPDSDGPPKLSPSSIDPRQFARRVAPPTSAFDVGDEGWTVTADGSGVVYRRSEDARGGFIHTGEASGGGRYFFAAPRKFLGDQSDAFGQFMRYKLRVRCENGVIAPSRWKSVSVVLVGRRLAIGAPVEAKPQYDLWTDAQVEISTAAKWRVVNEDKYFTDVRPATEQDMRDVLRDVRKALIKGEYSNSIDEAELDDVVFGAPLEPSEN
jgi:hypothetical protein